MAKSRLALLSIALAVSGCADSSAYGKSFLLQAQAERNVRDVFGGTTGVKFTSLRYNPDTGVVCGYVSAQTGAALPHRFIYQRGIVMLAAQFTPADFAVLEVKCIGALQREQLAPSR